MENLMFSLNATMPLFLLMMLGLFFRKIRWMDEAFAAKLNNFVFRVALPVMLFKDLATVNFDEAWNTKFVVFCFFATAVSILLSVLVAGLWKDRSIRGEYIQASYRSSAAILGMAFIQNIYGNSSMLPLMIIGSVPLYNVIAVLVLSIYSPETHSADGKTLKKTLLGVIKNPIIIGIAAGLLWSLLRLPTPTILIKTVSSLGSCASPLGLIAMGASLDGKKISGKLPPAIAASATKLLGFCILFLPVAVRMGFRQEELVAILVMLGSSCTVSSYVMVRNMGYEGSLTASSVMITTVFSSFTLTFWLYLLRTFGYV